MTRTLAVLLSLSTVTAIAQQRPTPEQVKAAAEGAKPGPEHQQLAALEGRWTQEITFNMGTKEPLKGRGTATNRMVLGQRFLISERSGEVATSAMGTMKMDAMTINGFDRRTSEYTIIELNDAILFLEMEQNPEGTVAGFWLSTYGLGAERLADARERFALLYRGSLAAPAV